MVPDGLQDPDPRTPITHSRLLLVEGRDPLEFFKALLRHLGLLDAIEIRDYRGISNLGNFLETLPNVSGFLGVDSMGIVRDAESQQPDQAFASVCSHLNRGGFEVPPRLMAASGGRPAVSVFVLPDCASTGMLESLCLRMVEHDPAWTCVERYFTCLQEQNVALPRTTPKAQVQAFLASRGEYIPHLGLAAHRGHWPWDDAGLDCVKEFLRAL